VVVEAAHVNAVQPVLTAAELLQQAGDVEEGGLAGAGRTRHRNELALAHVDVEVAQRMGLDHVRAVDLAQLVHAQHLGLSVAQSLIRMVSAPSKASVPEMTTRSPSLRPETTSTSERLDAP